MNSRFLNTLKTEEVSNNLYRTIAALQYFSKKLQKRFTIPPDVYCDFESCGMLRTSNEAGMLHDALYRYDFYPDISRRVRDYLYFEAMMADGNTPWLAARAKWAAVRALGWKFCDKKSINWKPKEINDDEKRQ